MQVLVTERDFANQSRLHRMHSTLEQILHTGAVPVLNENDVLSIPEKRRLFQVRMRANAPRRGASSRLCHSSDSLVATLV